MKNTDSLSMATRMKAWWASIQFPVWIAVLGSVVTLGFGVAAFQVASNSLPDVPQVFSRWDACHYEAIARFGYSASESRAFQICFFPLFPLLCAPLVPLLGNATLATLLVANVACIFAFVCVFRLAEAEFDMPTARLCVVALAIAPASFFFHLGYTESLFLATTAGSFLCARRGAWGWAGALAFLAALTRITGLALGPALLIEYLHQREFRWRKIRADVLLCCLPLAGFGVYLGMNYWMFGNPLYFLDAQAKAFFKSFAWFWPAFAYDVRGVTSADPTSRVVISLAHLVTFWLATALTVWSFFRLRPMYSVYMGVLWILIFCSSFWMSLPRLALAMFPGFFLVALLLRKRPCAQFACGFASVLFYGLFLQQFVRGWWAH